ncbi:unnamed protein product [Pelagomonas calceolata]|uniref:Anaphase-promoting complex subunit 11 n=1 Tax=Pelagomonas calceolata TaxID=35677 RepID=A0A8J2X2M5_9STRA|nr:unnamed protein product [Pelagomonas calceolata]
MPIARQPASNSIGARPTPFIKTASAATQQRINEVLGAEGIERRRMLLVSTTGPTSFVVAEQNAPDGDEASERPAREKHRVKIGHRHSCSCGHLGDGELCHHALFILLKVLRVPKDNPLAFQTSLLESELEAVLRFRALADQQARDQAKRHRISQLRAERRQQQPVVPVVEAPDEALCPGPRAQNAPQPPLDGEDCPICMDSLTDGAPLTYCPKTCGNWVHVRCLKEYAEHTAPREAKCPLCRDAWGGVELIQACKARLRREAAQPMIGAKGSDTHRLRCAGCGVTPIVGERYRCVRCVQGVDLCSGCFGRGKHGHHGFVAKSLVGDAWAAAPRVKARPNQWRPVAGLADANLPASALAALQYRDLGPNDYALLQQLDQPAAVPTFRSLGSYLTKGLASSSDGVCDVCGAACDAVLACGHGVHRACVSNAIDEGKPEDVLCPVCGVSAFPGLRRKPRRPRPEAPPSQPQAVAAFGSVVERSAFNVPRSPPPGPQGLEALVVGSTIGPAASVVGPSAGSLFTGSVAATSVVEPLAAPSLLETGSVFTLSNAAPMSPSSRAALAVAQRSQRAALERSDRAERARQRRAAAASRGPIELAEAAERNARADAALERRDTAREARRRAAADRRAAAADRRAARAGNDVPLLAQASVARDADAALERATAAREQRRRAVADRRAAVADRRAARSEPTLDAVAAMPPMWLADAVRSASAPEDGVLQRRRLLKQRQRLHEKKAVAARERRERLAGRVLVLAPPRLGFAHEC